MNDVRMMVQLNTDDHFDLDVWQDETVRFAGVDTRGLQVRVYQHEGHSELGIVAWVSSKKKAKALRRALAAIGMVNSNT